MQPCAPQRCTRCKARAPPIGPHLLELGLEAAQDLDGVWHRRLPDLHHLEAPLKGRVLLNVLPVLSQLQGGRAGR